VARPGRLPLKLTDEELIAAIESEEAAALDSVSGELEHERADALARYRGELLGNEVEGRSAIVDKGVMDTIQWIMPSLARIYLGGDEIGKFEPVGPEDEYAAECETEVCNWYLFNKNDLYSHVIATLTDALLLKNGYMVSFWTKREDISTETYTGMADEEVAMLMQDQDVEVVEHSEYPDMLAPQVDPQTGMPLPPVMLHDVKVERKKADEFVGCESIPPNELLVSRRHRWTSLMDADFTQWRRRVTIGQLRAEGFKIPDDVEELSDSSEQHYRRERYDNNFDRNDSTPDPSRKVVLFKDTYIRIDLTGKGMPKLWRIAYVDGMKTPVLKEEADIVPFAAFSPIIYPHSHVGTSVYDLIQDISLIKTLMQRQVIDSTFLQTNGMLAINTNTVNMDDALTRGPGRLIRVDGSISEGLAPVVSPDAAPGALAVIEYLDSVKEQRTGVTRYSAGLDADSLNKTATGITALQSAADQRIELLARTLANGFRDLFLITHAMASKHSTKPIQIKLKGQWKPIDPRSWAKRTDFSVSVSLGTGSPESQVMKIQMIAMAMEKLSLVGLVGPEEMRNIFVELCKAAGYKNPNKFVQETQKDPQTGKAVPPPPQKPEMVQAAEIKAQADMQKAQMEQQGKGQELQQQGQMDMQRMQGEMALQQSNDERQAQVDMQKLMMERENMEREYQLKRELAFAELEMKREFQQEELALRRQEMEMTASLQRETAQTNAALKNKQIDTQAKAKE
jgi:hypothetical protein